MSAGSRLPGDVLTCIFDEIYASATDSKGTHLRERRVTLHFWPVFYVCKYWHEYASPFFYRHIVWNSGTYGLGATNSVLKAGHTFELLRTEGRRVPGGWIKTLHCSRHAPLKQKDWAPAFDAFLSNTCNLQYLVLESHLDCATADARLLISVVAHVGHSLLRLHVALRAHESDALAALGQILNLEDFTLGIVQERRAQGQSPVTIGDVTPWFMQSLRSFAFSFRCQPGAKSNYAIQHLAFLSRCRFPWLETLDFTLPTLRWDASEEGRHLGTLFGAHPHVRTLALELGGNVYHETLLSHVTVPRVHLRREEWSSIDLPSPASIMALPPSVEEVVMDAPEDELITLHDYWLRTLLELKEQAGSRRLQVKVLLTTANLRSYVSYAELMDRLDDIREYLPALAQREIWLIKRSSGGPEYIIQ